MVCMDGFRNANRYRRRMASPPDAPSLLELAVRFIHLVTHAPGPAGGFSKNEMRGVARRGVFSRKQVGEAVMVVRALMRLW